MSPFPHDILPVGPLQSPIPPEYRPARGGFTLRTAEEYGCPWTWAIALSSAIFALGHGYQGTAGVVTVGLMGAAYATVYHWRLSLAAPIVMHFLQDFSGIVLPPLIAAGTGN